MSLKSRAQQLLENDITIYRLLLLGLFVASPSLHYLCYYNSYDPIWLRSINSALSITTLALSFLGNKKYYRTVLYVTIMSYVLINNYILLGVNGFQHVYLFSSITIFIALTLFCKKRWEFVTLSVINLAVVISAYYTSTNLSISPGVLIILLIVFTLIAYVSFLVMMNYNLQFKKAVSNVMQLNKELLINAGKLRNSQQQLHALISSVNDTIFELDENKICLNVWFGPQTPSYLKQEHFLNKQLMDIMDPAQANAFNEVYDYVIEHKKSKTLEFPSIYGQPKWFTAKAAPVFDVDGNYTKRISVSVTDITEQKQYADALRESEKLLIQAQHIAKTGNWWHDSEARKSYWSENLYALLEIENIPDGLSIFEYYASLIHPDDVENAKDYLINIAKRPENSLEHKFITPKGNLKYIKILRGDLQTKDDGKLKRVVGIIQDITESKLAEKAVKISQAELIEAQTIAKIGNWKWDSKTRTLAWSDEVNNIYEINLHRAKPSLYGRLLLKYIHPDDRYIVANLFDNPDNGGRSYEYRIITPRGNLKYISVIVGKKMYNDDGTLRKTIGTLQDITQRKKAEFNYTATERKYQLVLETIKLAAVSLDANGNIIFCNKYLANLLGYNQNEILGMNWMENFIPEYIKNELADWFVNNSVKAHFINPVICRNGETRIISWQNTISYNENGTIKETTSIGEDITLQQKAHEELISAKEQAERSSHFKSEFLSIMSHEIRTPMNAVIGTTNLLLQENPKPDQLEYLNTLKFSGENLLAIINDILDYNKIEAGKLSLARLPFNIQQLAHNIRKSFYTKAIEKNLQIILDIDDTVPELLIGDQVRLGQILINLVNNAIKFTNEGSVCITLKCLKLSQTQAGVSFTVTDTGIGIASENLNRIFEPFIQDQHVINNDYGGTGLGLAITKRLIELYNSHIYVKSQLGAGTTFNFDILFDKAEMKIPEPATQGILIPVANGLTGKRILVVDDNKMNLLIAAKFLRKWQAIVDEAANGQLAVEKCSGNSYDIIIMDLQMPIMDGFEATKHILKSTPGIPIIAFTADAMPETHTKAFEAGMVDYLTKPFVPDVLFEKVLKYCSSQVSADKV
ncbi:PAS domain S-box protein [Mucilaginibacter segetis]|uniref:histidine kinase n=1 Tax=Mucilaginibacter segetis TaxID=2793071 RepID=A0A934PWS7_9SPHI|nr:PAS domain S-box protein [Mucilaginibacter segetis]MBK0380911.1 PAS domain S-box protein [Mucilaginibacter segetis]